MPEFIVKPTFGEEIARLVAVDNLSFNQIVKSYFIRQSLILKYPGQIVPKDNKGVSAALMKIYDYKETDLKGIIKDMLNQEKKVFSYARRVDQRWKFSILEHKYSLHCRQ